MSDIIHVVHGNGLGDQMLDILGGIVFSTVLQRKSTTIIWRTMSQYHHVFGSMLYDYRLFDFSSVPLTMNVRSETDYHTIRNTTPSYHELRFPNPSASSAPRKLLKWIHANTDNDISIESLIDIYHDTAQHIRPAKIMEQYMLDPTTAANTVGVHIRNTDKVVDRPTCYVHVERGEYNNAMNNIRAYILEKVATSPNTHFFICGDNTEVVERFREDLIKTNPDIKLVDPPMIDDVIASEYAGIKAIRDMFCLSQCTTILQSVGYSTFSLLASMIGNKPLINYWIGHGRTLQYLWVKEEYPMTKEVDVCFHDLHMTHIGI